MSQILKSCYVSNLKKSEHTYAEEEAIDRCRRAEKSLEKERRV
jgi:hypothetical protein